MRIVYHGDGTKSVTDKKMSRSYDIDLIPFNERVTKAYYSLECNHKLRPGENYRRTKRVWEMDKARTEAGLD